MITLPQIPNAHIIEIEDGTTVLIGVPPVLTAGGERLPQCPRTRPPDRYDFDAPLVDQLRAIPNLLIMVGGFRMPGSVPPDPNRGKGRAKSGRKINPSRPPTRLEVADLVDTRLKDFDVAAGIDVTDLRIRYQPPNNDPIQSLNEERHETYVDRLGHRVGVPATIQLWVMMCRGEMFDQGLKPAECCAADDDHNVDGETSWLADHVDWIVDRHPDFPDDVKRMYHSLLRATGENPEKIQTCPRCGWTVVPRLQGEYHACTGCGRTWTVANEIRRLQRTQEGQASAADIAAELGITTRTIRAYKQAGRIMATGRRGSADLFQIDQVRRAHEKAQRNRDTHTFRRKLKT